MRILLAHNSTYYPSHGGGDKSNRLLMEALAERGHDVRVVTRVERFGEEGHKQLLRELTRRGVEADASGTTAVRIVLNGVDVRVLTRDPNLRGFFATELAEFDPDIIITSTDDPGQLLLEVALRAPRARIVHLVRATIAVPFGPDASAQSIPKTAALRAVDGVVGVSEYVASYVRKWGGIDSVHVPISLLEKTSEYPYLARFNNPYVSMVNPCVVKGIGIFLELADRMPDVQFAAVPTWGTTHDDLSTLRSHKNIHILPPFDNIDDLLRLTRILLVPSVWAEARSRLLMESMSRGVPVIASDIGGLRESHLGVDYLIPISPITRYHPRLDMNLVPVADVPPQSVDPWESTLRRLLNDREHFEDLSIKSRDAALEYVAALSVEPFEAFLLQVLKRPARPRMSEEKRRLLALKLRQRAKPVWLPGIEDREPGQLLLFCFPYAGGGTILYRSWRDRLRDISTVVAVRLPGRESRLEESSYEGMAALIDALAPVVSNYLDSPFAFFGHSMGAAIAFELARRLRRDAKPLPAALYVSAARAPQFRLHHQPPPEPSEEAFVEELKRLGGMPREILDNQELMRVVLPSLRADSHLYRNYFYQPGEPFDFPIFAYGGSDDQNVRPEHLEAWREQTTGHFCRREFSGGHFFVQSAPEFLTVLAEDLSRTGEDACPTLQR